MQYMLLIYGDEAGRDDATEEQRQAMYAEYGAFSRTCATKGQYVGGDELA